MLAGAVPFFVLAALVHNVLYGLTGIEDPVSLLLSVIGGPALLLAGLFGLAFGDGHSAAPASGARPPAGHGLRAGQPE
jgi:hypothetical protein